MEDVRNIIFKDIQHRRYRAVLTPERDGLLSGVEDAVKTAAALGVQWNSGCREGDRLRKGVPFAAKILPCSGSTIVVCKD